MTIPTAPDLDDVFFAHDPLSFYEYGRFTRDQRVGK